MKKFGIPIRKVISFWGLPHDPDPEPLDPLGQSPDLEDVHPNTSLFPKPRVSG